MSDIEIYEFQLGLNPFSNIILHLVVTTNACVDKNKMNRPLQI